MTFGAKAYSRTPEKGIIRAKLAPPGEVFQTGKQFTCLNSHLLLPAMSVTLKIYMFVLLLHPASGTGYSGVEVLATSAPSLPDTKHPSNKNR